MKEPTSYFPYFVISQYNEDISWLVDEDIIGTLFAKGVVPQSTGKLSVIDAENIGGNQYDIIKFIYENYDDLPDIICFAQANPFDHCEKGRFFEKVNLSNFASLETYEYLPDRWGRRASREIDGGFLERNTSWYIFDNNEHLLSNNVTLSCSFSSFDRFMSTLFIGYRPLPWLRFCPGSQYVVEKYRCTKYSKEFWYRLSRFFPEWTTRSQLFPTESFMVERVLWYVFSGVYKENPHCNLNPLSVDEVHQKHLEKRRAMKERTLFDRATDFYRMPDRIELFKEKLKAKLFKHE